MRGLGNPGGALPFTVVLDRAGAVALPPARRPDPGGAGKALVGFLR